MRRIFRTDAKMVLWSRGKGVMSRPDAGGRTSLLVQLTGPQPLTRTVMVTTPAPLRVVASGASSGRWLVYTSGPLRPGSPQLLCGTDKVSFVAPSQVAVAESARACPAGLCVVHRDPDPAAAAGRPRARVRAAQAGGGDHRLRAAQQLAVPGAAPVRGGRRGHQDRRAAGKAGRRGWSTR